MGGGGRRGEGRSGTDGEGRSEVSGGRTYKEKE